MQFRVHKDGRSAIVYAEGRFTFNSHVAFRSAIKEIEGSTAVDFDLARTTYLDSSALGMILIARDRLPGANIRLIHAAGDVLRVLEIANFGKLFYIK